MLWFRSQMQRSTEMGGPRPIGRVGRIVVEVVAIVVVLMGCAIGLAGAPWVRQGYDLDLTQADLMTPVEVIGFHEVEQNDVFRYRWSSDYSFVQLPDGYQLARGYLATVRLRAANPSGPEPLVFAVNEQPLMTLMPASVFRVYRFVVPPDVHGDAGLRLALQTGGFRAVGDRRLLGVMLTRLVLVPVPVGDWWVIGVVVGALLVLWWWVRWGSSAGAALALCGLVACGLVVLFAVYRPGPVAFYWLALAALLAMGVGVRFAPEVFSRFGLAVFALLVSFSGVLWSSWMTDDALISFRYAHNLVAGRGLVYNVGERVEGYTNFLWTMWAAGVLWLGGDPVWFSYVVGVVLALAILLLTYVQARRLIGAWGAMVAAMLVATSQSLLVYTARGSGLETGLFTFLALVGVGLYVHPRLWRWSGVVFGMTTLTRPEGVLLLGLTCLHGVLAGPAVGAVRSEGAPGGGVAWLRANVRLLVPLVAGYMVVFLPYFLWRTMYYGDLLPNTFYAKTGGGLRQVLRGVGYASSFALAFGGPLLVVALLPFLTGFRAAVMGWRGYVVVLIAVYTGYIIAVGGDHFPGDRFFVPLVPWVALVFADGLVWVVRRGSKGRLLRGGVVMAVALVVGGHALMRGAEFESIISGDDESVWIWREIGWWMADHSGPDEGIAAMGAGAIAYYSDRTTVDLLGLNDKHIARIQSATIGAGAAGHEKRDPAYVLDVRQPTYIPRMWDEYFGGEAVLRGRYMPITIRTRYGRDLELWKRVP